MKFQHTLTAKSPDAEVEKIVTTFNAPSWDAAAKWAEKFVANLRSAHEFTECESLIVYATQPTEADSVYKRIIEIDPHRFGELVQAYPKGVFIRNVRAGKSSEYVLWTAERQWIDAITDLVAEFDISTREAEG